MDGMNEKNFSEYFKTKIEKFRLRCFGLSSPCCIRVLAGANRDLLKNFAPNTVTAPRADAPSFEVFGLELAWDNFCMKAVEAVFCMREQGPSIPPPCYSCHRHVEAERHNKFSILLKMGLFCLLEYEMVRFINTTGRYCFVCVKDCAGESHILYKLNPGQSVLLLTPKSKHNFRANDTCTRERLILDFLKTPPTNHERVCRIKTQMETLKDLTLKILSQKYSLFPDKIEELRLPTQLKRELYFLTIPEPAEESDHSFCHECHERLPKVLSCNPVALCSSSSPKGAWISEDLLTFLRKFSSDLYDYYSTSDFLQDVFFDLIPTTNI